ncbi:tetratricopeptide repeat protein [Desulfococcaceae bacterium HSG8]|nr:tetratricopeptide repeat protein [Desulfococcaceae bacterium HSG8]
MPTITESNFRKETCFNIRCDLLICLMLVIAILIIYWQVRYHDFITYDDDEYVTMNDNVRRGLSPESIIWAFTDMKSSNWHPMTWLSHMSDVQLYGLNPGHHHMTNVLFHIGNTLLLFIILRRMSGDLWQSGVVAALFAVHPLHVESVAWVSERKDLLSTFFWMLTLGSYIRYVETPGIRTYLPVLIWFILGLMSKPMVVTLPFVLLLLDYWPMRRMESLHRLRSLVLEKIPLFALSAGSCIVTFLAQKNAGAVGASKLLPFQDRLSNAIVSYISYIGKMLLPRDLCLLYPHPGAIPLWKTAGACVLLISVFFLVIRNTKQRPYLGAGWLWYMGTLVPVIGLVQVGRQSMADRYTYIPLIGLFIIIAWGLPELLARCRYKKPVLTGIAAVTLSGLTAVAWLQTRYWRDSVTLYEHTLSITEDNYTIHYNMGNAFLHQNELDKAIRHYTESLRTDPVSAETHNNMGLALVRKGKIDEGIRHYSEAKRINPLSRSAYNNMGNAFFYQGRLDQAIENYAEAIRIDPDFAEACRNMGLALIRKGSIDKAVSYFERTLRLNPYHKSARRNLANILAVQERIDKAVSNMRAALEIGPESPDIANQPDILYKRKKELDEAIRFYQDAVSHQPGYTEKALDINNYKKVYDVMDDYNSLLPLFKKLPEAGDSQKGVQK